MILESLDDGETWSERIIYDIDETGMTAGDEPPDGSCSVIYDSEGNLHAAWGSFLYDGSGVYHESVDAEIRHWTQDSVRSVAWPDPDTTIVSHGGRNGNLASQPDLGVGYGNWVHLIYSQYIDEQDELGNYYEHIFGSAYCINGENWSGSVDITPGSGFDAAFPSVADQVDDYLHFTYTKHRYAGNSARGIHPVIPVAYMYHMVDVKCFHCGCEPVAVSDPDNSIPAYGISSNYPNPFNARTVITYSVENRQLVVISLYDVLGQEVAVLVNEVKEPGHHSIGWDAGGFPSGVYYYRLMTDSFTQTRKLVLLR